MKKKLFWFPLLAALLSTTILYTIGNLFEIPLLDWYFYNEDPSEWVLFEIGGSFLPIVIGLLIAFITERILKRKHKKTDSV